MTEEQEIVRNSERSYIYEVLPAWLPKQDLNMADTHKQCNNKGINLRELQPTKD